MIHALPKKTRLVFSLCLFIIMICSFSGFAEEYKLSQGQTVYVSVYSNILTAPRGIPFYLETTLCIRNTDTANSLTVTAADFFDTKGSLIKRYIEKPVVLKPLETTYVYLSEKEASGGVGANFIVRWNAAQKINAPIIESLMIGMRSGQGVSFISSGQVIKEGGR